MSVLNSSIPCFYYFEELTKIPHGSYNEKAISNYVVNFAKERNLKYIQDEMYNVIIYADATPGYEDHEPVMLQGHLDMVCEKNNDCDHDFNKDALSLYIDEDNWLHAKGTTLGADDGVAVAYMLALLDDPTIPHPALDCVFTVQEEVGLFGAANLKKKDIRAHRMINMDSGGETNTSVSSSGGRRCIVSKSYDCVDNTNPTYTLYVSGLLGGHSGGCIHLERGNANKLIGRLLHDMMKDGIDMTIAKLHGGLKENAIPREAEVTFATACPKSDIEATIEKSVTKIKEELEFSDAGLKVTLVEQPTIAQTMSPTVSKEMLRLLFLLPNGFKARSMKIEGLTTVSLNMGVMRTEGDTVNFYYAIRSPMKGAIEQLTNEIEELCDLLNAFSTNGAEYPGWNYEPNSPLRAKMAQLVKEFYQTELTEHAGHGGLETGILKGEIPDMDIVTFGPISAGAHTPDEKLDLKSFERGYDFIKLFLSQL